MAGPIERLDDRKAAILRAIVACYVRWGEPVGSKTLVERYPLAERARGFLIARGLEG